MPKYLTNTTFFNDGLGTYIANGVVQTNQVVSNGDVVLSGEIINGNNSITFNETTSFTNIPENFHIYGTGFIDYQGTTYNIGQLLDAFAGTGQISPYPSITYNSTTEETTFTGTLIFPNLSIASGAIINNDFLTYSTNQNVSGQKSFSGTQIFSTIQLNSDLVVNTGGTTITNAQLQLIPNISTNTTNISTNTTDITNLKTKTTNMSFSGTTTTFTGSITVPNNSISRAAVNGGAVDILTVQTISAQKTMSALFTCTNNLRLDGSLLVGTTGGTTILNSTLVKINNISDTTSAVGANLTSLQNQINGINTDLDDYALQSTVQSILDDKIGTMIYYQPTDFNIVNNFLTNGELQYSPDGTQKINLIPIITSSQDKLLKVSRNDQFDFFDISSNCHIYGKLQLGNYADVEYSLNAVIIAEGITAGFTGTNTTAIAFITGTTLPAMQLEIDGLGITVGDHSTDIGALQTKTSQISYNSGTDRTTVGQTLYSPYLEIGNLESGFNQTANEQITLSGLLRCNNRVEVNNTLELVNNNSIIVEGIINQDNANPPNAGVNQFQAPTNLNGNVIITNTSTTINATTTQIGTSAISTLNCNSTAIFGGDITMGTTKNLILKNIVPIITHDIYFGAEAGVYITDDVVFNMKLVANQPVSVNNTFQIGTTVVRNTLNSYTTTTVLDANTGMTLTTPTIGITSPLVSIGQGDATSITLNSSGVYIGQLLGSNYLYGTTYVQNLYSASGILGMAGQVFQQFQ
jgi:hypothetical protein